MTKLLTQPTVCGTCCARGALGASAAPQGVVELGHELAVGRAYGGEVLVAFFELEAQVDDLLLELAVLLGEAAGIGRVLSPCGPARRALQTGGVWAGCGW